MRASKPDVPTPLVESLELLEPLLASLAQPFEVVDARGERLCSNEAARALAADRRPSPDAVRAFLEVPERVPAHLKVILLRPGRLWALAYALPDDALERERESRVAAESASRMKDEFLALVSHELRTPLNALLGWATMLRSKRASPASFEKGLETIERNAKLQAKLVDDLLDLARVVSGKLTLTLQPTDLRVPVVGASEVVRPMAEAKRLSLEVDVPEEALPVNGDAERLQQVVWNLLTNAVKFTPAGGRVSLRLVSEPGWAKVEVRDDGEGISPDFLPFLFQRFRQADQRSTRLHGGLGLGLALVRHLVDLHAGEVLVHSDGVGKGSTFTVRLPLHA